MSESISTICVQGGYRPGDGEPRQIPIYQSTTWKYDTSEHMGKLFDLEEAGYFYTRLQNPTNDFVAAKIAEGAATKEEYAAVLSRRRAWRGEINEAEAGVAALDAEVPEDEDMSLGNITEGQA